MAAKKPRPQIVAQPSQVRQTPLGRSLALQRRAAAIEQAAAAARPPS
jgi:hypothetical protein